MVVSVLNYILYSIYAYFPIQAKSEHSIHKYRFASDLIPRSIPNNLPWKTPKFRILLLNEVKNSNIICHTNTNNLIFKRPLQPILTRKFVIYPNLVWQRCSFSERVEVSARKRQHNRFLHLDCNRFVFLVHVWCLG